MLNGTEGRKTEKGQSKQVSSEQAAATVTWPSAGR